MKDIVLRLREMLGELSVLKDVGVIYPNGRPLTPEEKEDVWDKALVKEAADEIVRLRKLTHSMYYSRDSDMWEDDVHSEFADLCVEPDDLKRFWKDTNAMQGMFKGGFP